MKLVRWGLLGTGRSVLSVGVGGGPPCWESSDSDLPARGSVEDDEERLHERSCEPQTRMNTRFG